MTLRYCARLLIISSLCIFLSVNAHALEPGHSGSWWNPNESGHGFSFEVGELPDGTPYVLAFWYVYDSDGYPVFLVGQGTPVGNIVEVEFQAPWGMVFGGFDPDTVTRAPGGLGRFTFTDVNNGTFEYLPSDWTVTNFGHAEITTPIVKLFSVSLPDPVIIEVPVGENAVVSWISGAFNGWDGDTIIELGNGQIWQQDEYQYAYSYAYRPDVVIYQRGAFWYASVDDSGSDHVRVKRLQ